MSEQHFELKDLNTPLIKEFCDHMPGGYFVYKADGNEELLYANRDVLDIFGCKNEDEFRQLTGYTFRGMVHPDDYPAVSESIIRQIAISEKKRDYVEYRICRKDGTVTWVNDYGHYVETEEFGGLYYVFISDVSYKRAKQAKENNVRETVIKTLTRFYHSVWVIDDIETEHWSLYYNETDKGTVSVGEIAKKLTTGHYTKDRAYLIENMVVPEDRERVRRELSIEGILEHLKEKDQFSITFLRQYPNGMKPRFFRIDIGKLELPDNRMGVTIGFKDVDDEFRAVREAELAKLEIQKTKEENKRLQEQFNAVKSVADLVDSITSILTNMPAMTFYKEAKTGKYVACNQAFANYADKATPEDVVGLTDYDLFDVDTANHFAEDDQTALHIDKPYVFFEDVWNGDKTEYRNLQTTKVKFTDNSGRLCIMGLCVDITEITQIKAAEAASLARQQELEERLKLQEKLLNEQNRTKEKDRMITALASDYRSIYRVDLDANDAVCYRSDSDSFNQHDEGIHFSYYEAFAAYARVYIDQNYQKDFLEFIDPQHIRENLSDRHTINYRYLIRRADKEYYEMISFANIHDPEKCDRKGVHSVVLGLTIVDREMRASIAKNVALAQALSAAQEASKAKTSFLSNMSHEIRTPMNAIIGLDSLALQDENLLPKTREYLEKINESAHHLMALINDILDMSRIESGRLVLRKEEFSFKSMLEQLNTMVMSLCADKGLRYECRIIGTVSDYYIGDDMKLKQVLINVLSNAVKFTDSPGSVTLQVERLNVFEDQSTLKFVITDTGIGISESFLPKIFDPFTQENGDKKNKYGSTGLGMAITKNIVELMNGTISVKSEKGVGSEFTVIVTLKNSKHIGASLGYIQPKDMRVLVVDSDKVAAEHARLTLGEMGIMTDTCSSGKEALRKLRVQSLKHSPYNLVLLDWMMHGMDGPETAKKIREQYTKETTVIIMTAFNWDEIMEHALSCGVDSFLSKPLSAVNVVGEFERIARKNNINLLKEKHRVDLKGKHILMAEDVYINAEIMKQLMLKKEVLIDHAENGRIAVDMFKNSAPDYYDAVLMDVRMPEMDGLEATAAIRAMDRPDAQQVPIIAMTANAFDEDVQRSLQVGMNAHLSKPVEPEHLYSTLEELIWEKEQKQSEEITS